MSMAFQCVYDGHEFYCKQAKDIEELFAHIPVFSVKWSDAELRQCFQDTAAELGIEWNEAMFEKLWDGYRNDIIDRFEL